jgi:beta-glucanase (GH16 family)
VPRTSRASSLKFPRHARLIAGAASIALVAGALQFLPSAGADDVTIKQVVSKDDSGLVDITRDGVGDYAKYGITNEALSVGEQPGDGSDLRLVLPFRVSSDALDAVHDGGSANISMKVWRADNLGARSVVVESFNNTEALTKASYARTGARIASVVPVEGRLALDVTDQVDSMTTPGFFTLRLRLDQPAAKTGGQLTQVNIATADAHNAINRPVLSVSSHAPADRAPVTTVPTAPPTTVATEAPTTTTTTTPPDTTPPAPPVTTPVSGAGQPPLGVTGGAKWKPIFDDDFNGSGVDPTKWNVQNQSNYGSGNHEDECYMAANTTVADGALNLIGKRETVNSCGANPDGGNNYFFTSGMVTTRAQGGGLKFKFRQGYAEIRMRVPRGNLYWPAFWLVGAGDGSSPGWPDYGEFDVTEIYGTHPDISESNFHKADGSIGAGTANVANLLADTAGININPPATLLTGGTNAWHTYGINWTANHLDWYVDGVKVRTYTAKSAADTAALGYEHSMILNLAMGGDGPQYEGYTGNESGGGYSNGNLSADLPGAMQVDYARVWQP